MTSNIYWHIISSQFFPLNTFNLAQDFETFYNEEISKKFLNKEIVEEEFLSLENLDKFSERILGWKEKFINDQLSETLFDPLNSNDKNNMEETKQMEVEGKEDPNDIDSMIKFWEKHLEDVSQDNKKYATELSQNLKVAYNPIKRREHEEKLKDEWTEKGIRPEAIKLWNILDMTKPDVSIYFDVAAAFLEDWDENLNGYLLKHKDILLDTWYWTNMEDKYFHYVASKHQEKNEINSQKLLKRISDIQKQINENVDADRHSIVKNHPLTKQLLNERRQKEEDAKCSIWGSGDYEENDLIVFWGFWGIAVHQNCYGVEEIPKTEWFWASWYLFGRKKGRNLKCMLWSKSGGAMKPTNVLSEDEFLLKVKKEAKTGEQVDLKSLKPANHYRIFKSEKKNLNLKSVMNAEHNHFANNAHLYHKDDNAPIDHHDNYYDKMDENLNYQIEKEHQIETKYAWAHLSWANFIQEIDYTARSPLKVGKLNPERFMNPCIIWCQRNGAAIRWSQEDCDIWMHGEWSRRAGYYMEWGKDSSINENESQKQNYSHEHTKIFWERHRPFKLIKEIREKKEHTSKEVRDFCKSIKKAIDIMERIPYKCQSTTEKKWKEKDKKILLDRVKEKFLLLRRLKINVVKIDPNKKKNRKYQYLGNKRRKVGENTEIKANPDQASVDGKSSKLSKNGEKKEFLYKIGTPSYSPEPDWSITLSRNDFPWYAVKFDEYTAKEWFDMYRSLITDEETFNRRIRKERNAMVNKLMKENRKQVKKAKQQGINAHQLSKKELKKKAEQIKELRKAQIKESSEMVQLQKKMTKEELMAYNAKVAEENSMYCHWRGSRGKDPDDFYVACDGKNCDNNGWYHWKWIDELKFKTKEEVDNEKEWFCPSCRGKREGGNATQPEIKNPPEGKFILILIMLTYFFVMKILWAQRFNSSQHGN